MFTCVHVYACVCKSVCVCVCVYVYVYIASVVYLISCSITGANSNWVTLVLPDSTTPMIKGNLSLLDTVHAYTLYIQRSHCKFERCYSVALESPSYDFSVCNRHVQCGHVSNICVVHCTYM